MVQDSPVIARFAPSPTGLLHIGHAYSAIFSYNQARERGGKFILRIEDIDQGRCREEFVQAIYDDLSWLGLSWEDDVRIQSEHFDDYKKALDTLEDKGLIYPCFCTRKQIQAEIESSASAPHGPEGALYPGTCRNLSKDETEQQTNEGKPFAMRLDVEKAISQVGELTWNDLSKGTQEATPQILGDVVLARKDTPASYHLCVTLDDHIQGITHVTRGDDLFYASHLHRLLQELLNLDVPTYHHHPLLYDEEGKRFAKRNQSVTLKSLREDEKLSPEDLFKKIGVYPL